MRGRLTVYPRDCAMHGAVQIRLPWVGYLTVMPNYFGKRNWSVCLSHNATPWAATVLFGPGADLRDRVAARARRAIFGLGRRSLAWCQDINDAVDMAIFVADQYPEDPPVSQAQLERRRAGIE
jgi:hypothetical protein